MRSLVQRAHQTEIKRRLEEFAKRERVHKIKVRSFPCEVGRAALEQGLGPVSFVGESSHSIHGHTCVHQVFLCIQRSECEDDPFVTRNSSRNLLFFQLERSNRYEEDSVRVLSPRPPTGARVARQQRSAPEGDRSESSESVSRSGSFQRMASSAT